MSKQALKRAVAVALKGTGGKPSASQLEAINALTLEELAEDQVYTRTFYVAHNGIDRDRESIEPALLKLLAKTLKGKGMFIKHPLSWDGDSGPGEGRWYAARVVTMSHDEAREALREPNLQFVPDDDKAYLLEASPFLLKLDENAGLRAKLDAGIAGDVSLGFSYADRDPVTDDAGNVIAYRLRAPGEAYEASLVWLGAQPGARAHKAANPEQEDPPEDNTVDRKEIEKHAKALGIKVLDNSEHEALVGTKDALDKLKLAVGDDLASNPDKLKGLISVANKQLDALVDRVVAHKRQAGKIGDDEESVKNEKAALKALPLEQLQFIADSLPEAKKGTQFGGDEPGGDRGARQEGDDDGLRDASKTKSALGGE